MGTLGSRRIVVSTYGSFGDVHPMIAIALKLRERGHHVVFATIGVYRERIEAIGFEFASVRPEFPPVEEAGPLLQKIMDPVTGPEFLVRELVVPHVRESYRDLEAISEGADLFLGHLIPFAGPLLHEKHGIKFVSTVLQPGVFFSVHDMPLPAGVTSFGRMLRAIGPWGARFYINLVRSLTRQWMKPVGELRRELGLSNGAHPLFEGQHSPQLVLALFSNVLAQAQPDWPPHTYVTGFPFYDRRDLPDDTDGLSPELGEFLSNGEPPIVFTLGSAAIHVAGDFYKTSVEVAKRIGRRAVLLTGLDLNQMSGLPDGMIACEYAPFGELLPRACAVVHQGGIGTTGQAIRSGRPMLVVPFAHDQPDNADRVQRLGVARVIPRRRYTADRAARELAILLNDPSYAREAKIAGERVRSEDGATTAANLIEMVLAGK